MTGRFISFEGIDGAGKTTHVAAVAEHFRQRAAAVVVTREPGGTPLAERLRELVLGEAMDALTESLLVFAARRDHLQRVIEPALQRGDTVLCDRFTDASFAYQGGGRGVATDLLRTLESWVHGGLQPDLTLWFDVGVRNAAVRRALRPPLPAGVAASGATGQAAAEPGDAVVASGVGSGRRAAAAADAPDAALTHVLADRPGLPDVSHVPPTSAQDRFERQGDAFFERVRAAYAQRQARAPDRVVRIDAESTRERVWQQIAAALAQRGW